MVLASLADAMVALGRISKFLQAEELAEPYAIDYNRKSAVEVDGDFAWETAGKPVEKFDKGGRGGHGKKEIKVEKVETGGKQKRGLFSRGKGRSEPVLPTATPEVKPDEAKEQTDEEEKQDEKPFELKNLRLKVPKGSFVAIVGRVGSGKVLSYSHILSLYN